MTKKTWYKSKTLWLNAVVGGLVALESTTSYLQGHIADKFYIAVAIGLPVLNAVLRSMTNQPITYKRGKEEDEHDA